jgi:hypothetical protein
MQKNPEVHADQIVWGEFDLRLMRLNRDWGIGRNVHKIIRSHYLLLAFKLRLKLWAQTGNNASDFIPVFFFPDWLYTVCIKLIINLIKRCKVLDIF